MFDPPKLLGKSPSKTLRQFALSSTTFNQLNDWQFNADQGALKLFRRLWHVIAENRFSVVKRKNLEPFLYQVLEHDNRFTWDMTIR